MKLFSICFGKTEFSVVGVANVATKTVQFQARANDAVYFTSSDYQETREVVMESFNVNKKIKESAN